MGRSIELTSLAHRKHYRAQEGLEYWLRLRFDAIPVSKARYERMSAPAQKAIIQSIQRIMAPLPLKKTPLVKADNVEKLSRALPPEEREDFAYTAGELDWWEYWINVHIPALRKWTYPLIEGRPLEARAPREFSLASVANGDASRDANQSGETIKTGTNGATWRYS